MNRFRHGIPVLCVLGLLACRDRSREATENAERDRSGRVDLPAAPLDRERTGMSDNREQNVGQTTVTGANVGVVQNASAIERIVQARCEREATCNNVGTDKHFSNRDVCQREIRADMKDDLNAKDCPAGIDGKELGECLDAIHKESCGNPLETISRLAACRTSDMCLKTGAPNR